MSKRKLYPDECPAFEVVSGGGEFHAIETGMHVTGTPGSIVDGFCDSSIYVRGMDNLPLSYIPPIYGGAWNHHGMYLMPDRVRPLTPAAVEMWEHVAGRRWEP